LQFASSHVSFSTHSHESSGAGFGKSIRAGSYSLAAGSIDSLDCGSVQSLGAGFAKSFGGDSSKSLRSGSASSTGAGSLSFQSARAAYSLGAGFSNTPKRRKSTAEKAQKDRRHHWWVAFQFLILQFASFHVSSSPLSHESSGAGFGKSIRSVSYSLAASSVDSLDSGSAQSLSFGSANSIRAGSAQSLAASTTQSLGAGTTQFLGFGSAQCLDDSHRPCAIYSQKYGLFISFRYLIVLLINSFPSHCYANSERKRATPAKATKESSVVNGGSANIGAAPTEGNALISSAENQIQAAATTVSISRLHPSVPSLDAAPAVKPKPKKKPTKKAQGKREQTAVERTQVLIGVSFFFLFFFHPTGNEEPSVAGTMQPIAVDNIPPFPAIVTKPKSVAVAVDATASATTPRPNADSSIDFPTATKPHDATMGVPVPSSTKILEASEQPIMQDRPRDCILLADFFPDFVCHLFLRAGAQIRKPLIVPSAKPAPTKAKAPPTRAKALTLKLASLKSVTKENALNDSALVPTFPQGDLVRTSAEHTPVLTFFLSMRQAPSRPFLPHQGLLLENPLFLLRIPLKVFFSFINSLTIWLCMAE
jgi:hypothetical protein